MELIGSRTEQNLRSAISGEAQAAVLYEFFGRKAKKEGYVNLSEIFAETARNEKAHAKIYLDLLKCIMTTDQNLLHSVETEHHESSIMYPEFAKIAREEGFEDIAKTFEMVGQIESEHEARFRYHAGTLQNNSAFEKGIETVWICNHCGHRHKGSGAPEICPVCKHPQGYFCPINEDQ